MPPVPPNTLAQLIRRRSGSARTRPEPVPDRLGQFGLLFTEPEVTPQLPTPQPAAMTLPGDAAPQPAQAEEPAFDEAAPAPAETAKERRLYTVSELVSTLRGRIEHAYADVWVEGEVSNYRPAPSGHLYFTLKDGDAQLPVVLFRREASLLKFRPQDGLAVLARGRISVYESRGQLQLIAETLEPRGAGALQLAFEQLKARLRSEGLFDAERKRPLPAFPATIGVITSLRGAVLRDIVTVCRRRHRCLNLLVFPVAVQGPTCAPDVIRGLRFFNSHPNHRVDVIVVARGGGSAEDLSGFNDEALARAIAASELPVVSAIGHETDFTIADFVADLRAPTPSAAAEIVTAAQHRIEERIQNLATRLVRAIRFQHLHAQQRLARVAAAAAFARMRDAIGRRQQRVDDRRFRMESASRTLLQARSTQLRLLSERLQAQDIRRTVLLAHARNERLLTRLHRIGTNLLLQPQRRIARAETHLQALSPTAVLERGYALVFNSEGKLLRNHEETIPGDTITARLAKGSLKARVLSEL